MAAPKTARVAPARADSDPQKIEQLPGRLDTINKQKFPRGQLNYEANWLRRDFIGERASILESLAVSLREACFRGSDIEAGVHLRQIRAVVVSAISEFKEIDTEGTQ
jgi:hypothetical protein